MAKFTPEFLDHHLSVKVRASSSINMIELKNKLDIEMKSYLNIRNMIFILIYLFVYHKMYNVYHKMYNVNVFLELIILHRTSPCRSI